ncbi:hypothetical protein Nans01_38090 [Nocardiopsis ansamitocini]|uniref:Uncharacterized protein n=1 Tax=Nocardiopsis ansamitocini TaxID=1670832 RepID=A0A9W6UKD1_9ACTN|nr:hypothetical protein Nans01_38090 [Nocardiopsis ansamitocini]
MLLAGPADPQHVVEEQVILVAGGEPLQLQVGTVHDDLAQSSYLGRDGKGHDSSVSVAGRPLTGPGDAGRGDHGTAGRDSTHRRTFPEAGSLTLPRSQEETASPCMDVDNRTACGRRPDRRYIG